MIKMGLLFLYWFMTPSFFCYLLFILSVSSYLIYLSSKQMLLDTSKIPTIKNKNSRRNVGGKCNPKQYQ